jgi:hypothetical protein
VRFRRDEARDEALLGLECALPSRELKLAQPRGPRPGLWKRALGWIRSGFRARPTASV